MKRLLTIALVALCLSVKAQTVPVDTVSKTVAYAEVVTVDSISKDELYTRAREWFAKTYRSSQSVIQMDDKSSGKIVGKGSERGQVYAAPLIYNPFTERYTISITVKDNKYRYEITDFTTQVDRNQYGTPPELPLYDFAYNQKWKSSDGTYRKVVKGYIEKTAYIGSSLSESLKKAMSAKSTGIKPKDDF
jgi:hypothetical protein